MSECDHYVRDVRRNNFLQMWLNEYNADAFISTHLYGVMNDVSMVDIDDCEKEDALNTSVQLLSATFVGRVKRFNRQREQVTNRLTASETFFAILKGYCGLSILMTPKAFSNGGWGASGIFMITSGILSLMAVRMLVEAGLATKLYSYPLIVEKILGPKSRVMLEITIAMTQYAFAVSHIVFLISSW